MALVAGMMACGARVGFQPYPCWDALLSKSSKYDNGVGKSRATSDFLLDFSMRKDSGVGYVWDGSFWQT